MIQADRVVFLTLLCLVGVGIFTSESFLNKYNLTSIMRDAAALGIVSMGQAVVMIGGGLDISVGSIVSLTTILAALLINGSDAMIPIAVIVCLGRGNDCGFSQWFCRRKVKNRTVYCHPGHDVRGSRCRVADRPRAGRIGG